MRSIALILFAIYLVQLASMGNATEQGQTMRALTSLISVGVAGIALIGIIFGV